MIYIGQELLQMFYFSVFSGAVTFGLILTEDGEGIDKIITKAGWVGQQESFDTLHDRRMRNKLADIMSGVTH